MYKEPHLPFQNINLSADSTDCKNIWWANKQTALYIWITLKNGITKYYGKMQE